ncbi:Bicarbonate transporter protein [Lasiodiplodia theobromae]|uniref:Putative transporter n=1 Tax=Lasiodiplodia theobromae TaxID=45133 RepID=A0A5N5D3K4_9PEZI|nr:Bicarbonate transporter protein [Lasiodiplodia theobromae]KAB2571904.1 putative transporter [Lasiodiplodia theobromae]KAF4539021.1 Bicarbonate transporter protein [Lasiodiplodia theobromae]KAF9637292.1 Bicarbonate transporter protein [Lasiodiplodia theobromae]
MARGKGSVFAKDGVLRPFRLLRQDWGNLSVRYVSDWTVFNQLIFASAVYVFFTNLLPGITFASDLYELTGENWGTIEVVFSTGLCGIIFSLFSIQPLTILGVTGPFSILAENIYSLCTSSFHIPFLPFMAWSLIHACWMHWLLAIFNAHDYTMRYVTTFSTEIFSLLNSIIYFHKAIQELERAHSRLSFAAFLYAIIGCIGTCLLAIFLASAEKWKPLFHRYIRMGLAEYAAAISIIIFIGIPYAGELANLDKDTLHVSTSFRPSSPERSVFFVKFWELPVAWIFAALIPGAIITALFFFDHEVSSIICTINRYGTRKPGGFAWDIVLLGTTTAVCGILGIPPANGLLPQAPLHSESLMHDDRETIQRASSSGTDTSETRVSRRVYEQRWSHFLHAAGIMAFVSPPLMHVLGLTPTSVLAGLFLFMGEQSLSVNPILWRTFHLLTPPSELPQLPQTIRNYAPIHLYTLTQIIVTVIIFIVTLTKAGPAFPIIIILLVPIRLNFMNRIWNRETLRYVDAWACRDGTPEDDEDRREDARKGPTDQSRGISTDVETGEDEENGNGSIMLRRLGSADRKE